MTFLYAYLVVGFVLAVTVFVSEATFDACRENGPWLFRAALFFLFPWHALVALLQDRKAFPHEIRSALKALWLGHSAGRRG